MARRATSPSKKQAKAQTPASRKSSKPEAAEASRRVRKAKSDAVQPADASLTDILFGSSEETNLGSEAEPSAPAPTRRRRRSKPNQEVAAAKATDDVQVTSPPAETAPPSDGAEPEETQASQQAPASRKVRRRSETSEKQQPEASTAETAVPQPTLPSAARWDATTGTVTFDWPSIEQVAGTNGPNQAMANLLLAARAEGANSRWPF